MTSPTLKHLIGRLVTHEEKIKRATTPEGVERNREKVATTISEISQHFAFLNRQ